MEWNEMNFHMCLSSIPSFGKMIQCPVFKFYFPYGGNNI